MLGVISVGCFVWIVLLVLHGMRRLPFMTPEVALVLGWVSLTGSALLLVALRYFYINEFLTPKQPDLLPEPALKEWRRIERGRLLENISEVLLLAVLVGTATLMLGESEGFTGYLRERTVAALSDVLGDPKKLEQYPPPRGLLESLSRSSVLAMGSTVRGPLGEELYRAMADVYLPMLDGPVRRNMNLHYYLEKVHGADLFEIRSVANWNYAISDVANVSQLEVAQPVHLFLPRGVVGIDEQEREGRVTVDGVVRKVRLQRQKDGIGSGDVENPDVHFAGKTPIVVRRGKETFVEIEITRRIPPGDYSALTFANPADSFNFVLHWKPDTLIEKPHVYLFTIGRGNANSKLSYTTSPNKGTASWRFPGWVFPECGLILTWQVPSA